MRQLGEFLRTTIIGGLLVLFPLFGCAFIIVKIGGFLTNFMKPLVSFVPQYRFIGVALADALSVLIIILLCFFVGLLVQTSFARALASPVNRLLNRIPGYRIFLRISRIVFDSKDTSGTPVVVQRGESKQIGFMMEETGAEELTIFFPEAPGLFSGTVEIVPASTVKKLNVPAVEVARVIATFGTGTSTLLANEGGERPAKPRSES